MRTWEFAGEQTCGPRRSNEFSIIVETPIGDSTNSPTIVSMGALVEPGHGGKRVHLLRQHLECREGGCTSIGCSIVERPVELSVDGAWMPDGEGNTAAFEVWCEGSEEGVGDFQFGEELRPSSPWYRSRDRLAQPNRVSRLSEWVCPRHGFAMFRLLPRGAVSCPFVVELQRAS